MVGSHIASKCFKRFPELRQNFPHRSRTTSSSRNRGPKGEKSKRDRTPYPYGQERSKKERERSKVTRSREKDLYGTQNPQDIKCMIENLHTKVIEKESTREGGEKLRLGEFQPSHPVTSQIRKRIA